VAVTAFVVTLKWPSGEAARALAATVSATASTPIALSSTPHGTQAREDPERFACGVTSITDGDTLRCDDGTRVRLHAVAARERDETCSPGHPCPAASAEESTATLRRLASGQALSCESTGRSYGRVTAVCWTRAGTEINCAMVRSGTAVVWDRYNRQRPLCLG
jgi:endonuclease YncB( thermonuclease family)